MSLQLHLIIVGQILGLLLLRVIKQAPIVALLDNVLLNVSRIELGVELHT